MRRDEGKAWQTINQLITKGSGTATPAVTNAEMPWEGKKRCNVIGVSDLFVHFLSVLPAWELFVHVAWEPFSWEPFVHVAWEPFSWQPFVHVAFFLGWIHCNDAIFTFFSLPYF